jgi:hypothetical protein
MSRFALASHAEPRFLRLARDVACGLVDSDAQEAWVAEFAVHCPFGKGDLYDDRRAHPMGPTARKPDGFRKRWCSHFQPVELCAQIVQALGVKACADFPAKTNSCASKYPTSRAPRPTRAPCGSVKPPMTDYMGQVPNAGRMTRDNQPDARRALISHEPTPGQDSATCGDE